jgi:hypothetical protein
MDHVLLARLPVRLTLGKPFRDIDVETLGRLPISLEQMTKMREGCGPQTGLLRKLLASKRGLVTIGIMSPTTAGKLPGTPSDRVSELLDEPEAIPPARHDEYEVRPLHQAEDARASVRTPDPVFSDDHPGVLIHHATTDPLHHVIVSADRTRTSMSPSPEARPTT